MVARIHTEPVHCSLAQLQIEEEEEDETNHSEGEWQQCLSLFVPNQPCCNQQLNCVSAIHSLLFTSYPHACWCDAAAAGLNKLKQREKELFRRMLRRTGESKFW
jgi:hypothetical protein